MKSLLKFIGKFFNQLKLKIKTEVMLRKKANGYIKFFNLEDWWFSDLNEKDRIILLNLPISDSLFSRDISGTSATPLSYLTDFIAYLNKPELLNTGQKLIFKVETFVKEETDIIKVHFFYGEKLKFYYKNRDVIDNGLDLAIEACKQQIEISKIASELFINDGYIPSHIGYEKLATIYINKKHFKEAIHICEKAKSQGWVGDWDKKIERCNKKLKA